MSFETIFPKGMIFKRPNENAPTFIKGKISFKVDEFIEFLQEHDNKGWVNIDLLQSKENKLYLKLDDWKKEDTEEKIKTDDLPF